MEIQFKVGISPEEKRQELYSALLMASGVILMGIFLGLFFFPLCLISLLAYFCFSTYLKVSAQEKSPDILKIEDNNLVFLSRGKKVVVIPLSAIGRVEYKDGIVVFLKQPLKTRILLLEPQLLSKKKLGDFYFEWFEPKAFQLLTEAVKR